MYKYILILTCNILTPPPDNTTPPAPPSGASPGPHRPDGELPGVPEEDEPSSGAGRGRWAQDTALWKPLQAGETAR